MRKLLEVASLVWMVVGIGLVSAVTVTAIRSKELPHVWGSCDMRGAEKGGPPFEIRPLPREQWIRRPGEVFVAVRAEPSASTGSVRSD